MLRPVWGTTGRTPARRQRLLCGFGLPRGRLQRTTDRGRFLSIAPQHIRTARRTNSKGSERPVPTHSGRTRTRG